MGAIQSSHRSALAEVGETHEAPPTLVEVLAGNRAITIPTGPAYSDNFVTGLALDFTAPGGVPHPNLEREDVAGSPLLAVATSDGVLRFYRFASTEKSLEGVVTPPLELIREAPAFATGQEGAFLRLPGLSCDLQEARVQGGPGGRVEYGCGC